VTSDLAFALARVPDLPAWVDTRGMLLAPAPRIWRDDAPDADTDFVVTLPARALASVVGRPPRALIQSAAASLGAAVNVLGEAGASAHLADALPGWQARTAILHTLPPHRVEPQAPERTSLFTRDTAPPLDHLPTILRQEIDAALAGRPVIRFVGDSPPSDADAGACGGAVAAAWAGGRPVAFCYPVVQTETLWDVSIDTMEAYRGQGLGGLAARAMIASMARRGKAPVWGALSSNAPSLRLAARLGFVVDSRLVVFARE
jgi:hypothetical protein